MKIWDLNGSLDSALEIIYDHQNQVKSIDTEGKLLGSFDIDGSIYLRDINDPQQIISDFKVNSPFEHNKIGILILSQEQIALSYNSCVEVYGLHGRFCASFDFDCKVVYITHFKGYLVAGMNNLKKNHLII